MNQTNTDAPPDSAEAESTGRTWLWVGGSALALSVPLVIYGIRRNAKAKGDGRQESAAAPTAEASKSKRRMWVWIAVAAVLLSVPPLVYELHFAFTHESTDDAFIDAHVSTIGARVEGQATTVLVEDNQLVKKGEVLAEIDPPEFEVKLDQARAQLVSARAVALRTRLDLVRYQTLARTDDVSRQQVDTARADADSAEATVRLQEAVVRQAELNLSYTRVLAPDDGRVTHRAVDIGDYLKVGQPLMAIVPSRVYVTANFKETQLTHMKPGQPVDIKVDVYPKRHFHGHVESIQSGTGAQFSLLPPENATGNYVKVVERIPVKITIDSFDDAAPLSPGMSVEPTVALK
jgi:membrane fusion protein (multidrug efflux system)